MLGMLSPWLQEASVRLSGTTFEHASFELLTDASQPWLVSALRDLRFFEVRASTPCLSVCSCTAEGCGARRRRMSPTLLPPRERHTRT